MVFKGFSGLFGKRKPRTQINPNLQFIMHLENFFLNNKNFPNKSFDFNSLKYYKENREEFLKDLIKYSNNSNTFCLTQSYPNNLKEAIASFKKVATKAQKKTNNDINFNLLLNRLKTSYQVILQEARELLN